LFLILMNLDVSLYWASLTMYYLNNRDLSYTPEWILKLILEFAKEHDTYWLAEGC
jgi:hypothetical protein